VNTEHLRKSLKVQWLDYYRKNRDWLVKLGIWVNCEGQRRPSSSFILATLSVLEPQLIQLLPLIVDLSSNPDRIVLALGLNFNPDEALEALNAAENSTNGLKMLPGSTEPIQLLEKPSNRLQKIKESKSHLPAKVDESCQGVGRSAQIRQD
jgi:hypothetical protein